MLICALRMFTPPPPNLAKPTQYQVPRNIPDPLWFKTLFLESVLLTPDSDELYKCYSMLCCIVQVKLKLENINIELKIHKEDE